jgi:hypothetical protein
MVGGKLFLAPPFNFACHACPVKFFKEKEQSEFNQGEDHACDSEAYFTGEHSAGRFASLPSC